MRHKMCSSVISGTCGNQMYSLFTEMVWLYGQFFFLFFKSSFIEYQRGTHTLNCEWLNTIDIVCVYVSVYTQLIGYWHCTYGWTNTNDGESMEQIERAAQFKKKEYRFINRALHVFEFPLGDLVCCIYWMNLRYFVPNPFTNEMQPPKWKRRKVKSIWTIYPKPNIHDSW